MELDIDLDQFRFLELIELSFKFAGQSVAVGIRVLCDWVTAFVRNSYALNFMIRLCCTNHHSWCCYKSHLTQKAEPFHKMLKTAKRRWEDFMSRKDKLPHLITGEAVWDLLYGHRPLWFDNRCQHVREKYEPRLNRFEPVASIRITQFAWLGLF